MYVKTYKILGTLKADLGNTSTFLLNKLTDIFAEDS